MSLIKEKLTAIEKSSGMHMGSKDTLNRFLKWPRSEL